MQIGMVGLGRMGANLVRRLLAAGHQCVVYDTDPAAVRRLRRAGAAGAPSLAALVERLDGPRAVWVMVPHEVAGTTIAAVADLLDPGDIVIDGGNSDYRDSAARARALRPRGIHHLDVGTSGGIHGLERGFCLMIGGDPEPVRRLDPIFAALAPGVDAAPRTLAGRRRHRTRPGAPAASSAPSTPTARAARTVPSTASTAEHGYLHCGPPGAGHFVKMVHNGIEYGLMAAYAEGFNLLASAATAGSGTAEPASDAAGAARAAGDGQAATTGGGDPGLPPVPERFDLDLAAVAELWRRGSVVSSWLLDLTAAALAEDPQLEAFDGYVSDSGEGRWTVETAVDRGVPVPVLSAALFGRFASQGRSDVANRLLSAMRARFGGHREPGR